MSTTTGVKKAHTQDQLEQLRAALDSGALTSVVRMLNSLKSQDVAHLLESSPPKMRTAIWQLIDIENEGDIIQALSEDVQAELLGKMDAQELVAITEGMDSDDIADILQQLPDRIIREVLQSMGEQDRARVEQVINFDEDSAGGLMDTEMVTIRAPITLDVVLRYLRRHEELPETTDNIFVVNRKDQLIGLLPLSRLLVSDPGSTVREVMTTDIQTISVDMPSHQVALLFERNDWISAPVVDENNKLLGRITIDDIVDVIRDEAEHNLLGMAGLSEDEDTFASIRKTAPRRSIWLGINLITAIFASAVIKTFEGTIDQLVALAVLMPIVASMGGVAGSQTLTVVIRGMALGHIGKNNIRWLFNREILVGLLNGVFWAIIVALVAIFVYEDTLLGVIIAAAIIINLATAAISGTLLPIILKRLNIDPALAGSVVLTTITDVVGFLSFLGLATWIYMS